MPAYFIASSVSFVCSQGMPYLNPNPTMLKMLTHTRTGGKQFVPGTNCPTKLKAPIEMHAAEVCSSKVEGRSEANGQDHHPDTRRSGTLCWLLKNNLNDTYDMVTFEFRGPKEGLRVISRETMIPMGDVELGVDMGEKDEDVNIEVDIEGDVDFEAEGDIGDGGEGGGRDGGKEPDTSSDVIRPSASWSIRLPGFSGVSDAVRLPGFSNLSDTTSSGTSSAASSPVATDRVTSPPPDSTPVKTRASSRVPNGRVGAYKAFIFMLY